MDTVANTTRSTTEDGTPIFIGRCTVCQQVVEYDADEPALHPQHDVCNEAIVAAYEAGFRAGRRS